MSQSRTRLCSQKEKNKKQQQKKTPPPEHRPCEHRGFCTKTQTCRPQFALAPPLRVPPPHPRPRSLTSAPTTSVDAHLLGPGCQGRAPGHHLGPPPPPPTLPAQPEPVRATTQSEAECGRAEDWGGKERPGALPSPGNSLPPTPSRPRSPAQNGDDEKGAGASTTIHLLRERALAGPVYWSPSFVGQPWPALIGKRMPPPRSPCERPQVEKKSSYWPIRRGPLFRSSAS